jgi:methyl-accepting chemotaxis protein
MKNGGLQDFHRQNNGNIGRKLQWLMGISLAGLAILATYSYFTLRDTAGKIRAAESLARVHGAIYNSIIQGKDAEADVLPPPEYIIEPFLTANLLAEATDPAEAAKLTAQLGELQRDYDKRHEFWSRTLSSGPLQHALVVEAHAPAEKFFEILNQEFLPASARGDRAQAMTILKSKLAPEYNRQRAVVDTVVSITTAQYASDEKQLGELLAQGERDSAATLRRAGRMLAVMLLATLAAAGLAGWIISRRVTASVRDIATQLNEAAQLVGEAAQQSAANSQSLAQGASEQSSSLEESSSALQELTSMSALNSKSITEATELARKTHAAAETGARHMTELNTAIQEINASSDDISKIIKTIDEIAFQTNILALNAAVEAARAGEAGMGFAVVAEEVRHLAQRSAQAAKETAAKIEGALSRSARSADLSQRVNTAFDEILVHAKGVDDLDKGIAAAAHEENQGLIQIAAAVTEIEKVTQNTAASAEENAAAAQELTAQAVILRRSVSDLQQLAGGQTPADVSGPPTLPPARAYSPMPAVQSVPFRTPPAPSLQAPAHALNCWEFKKCGREAGGARAEELGVCPAYPDHGHDCASLAGTLCGGKVQGNLASKIGNCANCEFFRSPHYEKSASSIHAQ